MATFLNQWNPKLLQWDTNGEDSNRTRTGYKVRLRWSASQRKSIAVGDRIFLGTVGQHPKGIIASGHATSPSFKGDHWQDPAKKPTNYNEIQFDTILTPDMVMLREHLLDGPLGGVHWCHQSGGLEIPHAAAALLEERWSDYLDSIGFGRPEFRFKTLSTFDSETAS